MPDDYRSKRVYPTSRASAWASRAENLLERHNSAQQQGANTDRTLPTTQPKGQSTLRDAYRKLKGFFGRRTTLPQGMTGNNRRFMREMSE